ncbi:MAG: 16S rRNA (uracil(1498)-N(3))-methyltransferase [Bdellovibrio bacteriovorus]
MRLPRVFVDLPLIRGQVITLPEGPGRHLTQVLRLGVGASLWVFNGDGSDYGARLVALGHGGTTLAVGERGPEEPPPPVAIRLAIGVSKGERMDYAIQKSVELGVTRISPLFTERSVVQLSGDRLTRRMAHWQGILVGACEQSGRRRLPRLDPAAVFADWIGTAPAGSLLLDAQADDTLVALPRPGAEVTLLVGPEGGLSPSERRVAKAHGCRPVRLGPRVLRTETAPLAAIAAIQALWGDFGA